LDDCRKKAGVMTVIKQNRTVQRSTQKNPDPVNAFQQRGAVVEITAVGKRPSFSLYQRRRLIVSGVLEYWSDGVMD
jgi:hypothetical protein